jgi:hypothetical protein
VEATMSKTSGRVMRSQVTLSLVVSLFMSACSGGGVDSTAGASEGEAFLAYGVSLNSSGDLSFGSADIVTFRVQDGSLVPSTRLANGANAGAIRVFTSFDSVTLDYEGFPLLRDGSFGVWQQSGDENYLEIISPSDGGRKRIFKSSAINEVSYFSEEELFVVNADFCYAVRATGETRRLGRGECAGSKTGLRFISSDQSKLTIYSVNSNLELSDRRTFPLRAGRLSAGGALVYGETAGSNRLAVFDVATGERVWSESEGDIDALVLAVAAEGDAIVIGHDRDDGDSLLDLVGVLSGPDGSAVSSLGSVRSVGVQLSNDGRQALIASRAKTTETYSFKTAALSGNEVQIPYRGDPDGFAIGKSDVYLYISDGTLYVGRFGELPKRAFDLFGEVTRLIEIRGTDTLLVVTEFESESTVTVVDVGGKVSARVIAEGSGQIQFSSQFGSYDGRVLFTLREDDGYGTLYEVTPSSGDRAKRIAEGNLAVFSYGPGGDIFYADAFGGNYSSYRVPKGDQNKRLMVSNRYVVLRQGAQLLRETSGGLQGFMDAYVDPVQLLCASEGIKTVTLAPGEFEVAIPDSSSGSVSLCVKVPKAARDKKLDIIHTPVAPGSTNIDTAIEVFTSTNDMRDDVQSIDELKLVASNDDTVVKDKIVLTASVSSVSFDRPTYIIRSSSWSSKVNVRLSLSEVSAPVASESYGFAVSTWRQRATSSVECKDKPQVAWQGNTAGAEIKARVGVDGSGNAEIYQFCLNILKPSDEAPSQFDLVVSSSSVGVPTAELVLGCNSLRGVPNVSSTSTGQYRGSDEREFLAFRSPSSGRSILTMSYLVTKGLYGPCYVTHAAPNPSESGAATRGDVSLGLFPASNG